MKVAKAKGRGKLLTSEVSNQLPFGPFKTIFISNQDKLKKGIRMHGKIVQLRQKNK